ncbi:hypothetical protein BHE74_00047054 [Ensete ventricosum]|nr:hypothetical protein BHE74_00047054 [Ensete ventricosum]
MLSTLLLQVDELLSLGINVTIYNGQVRTAHNHSLVTCYLLGDPQKKPIQTFTFEILVPVDQPCISLQMIAAITHSPAVSS